MRLAMVAWCVLALSASARSGAQEGGPAFDMSGRVRLRFDDARSQPDSTLTLARQLGLPGVQVAPATALLATDIKLAAGPVVAAATLGQAREQGQGWSGYARLNELSASGSALGWYYTAGRKIVSWDVGWGFRPNDLIQQEARLVLTDATLQGRPLLMVEKFDDDAAWSLVAVNPARSARSVGGDEPALAARYFRHVGAFDLHGFGRWGARTHGSIGAALSWVASENTELHASWNGAQALDTLCVEPVQGLVGATPARDCTTGRAQRILLGSTWSSADNLTVVTEWWWDGGAPAEQRWRDWYRRNRSLSQLAAHVGPADRLPLAANLAWQSDALLQTNLHRSNVLASFNWADEKYAFSLYALWHPADAGRIYTATMGWSASGWELNGGARLYGGPRTSVTAQLPARWQLYLGGSWKF
ncbi:MAG TPA: hypothetical protein VFT05_02800 [Burkholderiaceae bacterium]|nr:hypothetical protein [Burkholderiaceae bacterium]